MGLCKDCIHWSRAYFEGTANPNGACSLTQFEGMTDVFPDSKAHARGEYRGYLETAPDFGCVQFKAKGG